MYGVKQGYSGFRPDILSMMTPLSYESVLDVGCGEGLLGVQIKEVNPSGKVYGVEGDIRFAEMAKQKLENCWHVNLNADNWSESLNGHQFDLIVFADVLEHLQSPEKVLQKAIALLVPGGHIITCIPNVRHWSTFYWLAVRGTWPANERGIFDKTHLHFYARKDILALLNDAGLEVVKEKRNVRVVEPWSWTNIPGKLLDWWPFRNFFTFQYLHLSARASMPGQANHKNG